MTHRAPHDDLGRRVPLARPARRVVSLVPSITEALALTAPERLVGATDWCTHPVGLDVARVRGTKNPDRAAIAALTPDLVVANQEENRRLDVDRLEESGVPVWVTRIDTVEEALTSLSRLVTEALRLPEPGWLADARAAWSRPGAPLGLRVAVPVWRDPWLWVGADTYADDVLRRLGCTNVVTDARYPTLGADDVLALAPDVVLLPDEPYPFGPDDAATLDGVRSVLLPGRPLFWYGPAMVTAPAEIRDALAGAHPRLTRHGGQDSAGHQAPLAAP